ncbi:MAG TPA: VOC family protein [Caulobacteraceae bacterium]|jgi:predicted enzyme related to lactoylglutathione lyase
MKVKFGVGLALAAGWALAAGTPEAGAAEALSLGFVKFNVADQDRMVAFYEKAFGLTLQKVAVDSPQIREVILTNPKGLDLALVRYKDGRRIAVGSAEGPIGFYLKDAKAVDDAYASALAAGAVSKAKPGGGGGLRVATVIDPEGHEIELLHLP